MLFELTKQQRTILKVLLRMRDSNRDFSRRNFYQLYSEASSKRLFVRKPAERIGTVPIVDTSIDFSGIALACEGLKAMGYIDKIKYFANESDYIQSISLSYKGIAYNELRRLYIRNFLFHSILVPFIVAAITAFLTAKIPQQQRPLLESPPQEHQEHLQENVPSS